MVKLTNTSTSKPKETRGQHSDFSGEKEDYLVGLSKDFLNCKDRTAFYDEAAQGLIERFGYSHDGKVYVDGDDLSKEAKLECYKGLRSVSNQLAIMAY